MNIRKANKEDINFLAEIILLSEATGYELVTYQKMFALEKEELHTRFTRVLNNDFDGHPLGYKTYFIAESNGISAAAASGYKETEYGDSDHLMTGALMTVFNNKELSTAFRYLSAFRNLEINKTSGAYQIYSIATLPEYRGLGLFKQIYHKLEEEAGAKNCKTIELQVWKGNDNAINLYHKLGFEIVCEKVMEQDINKGKLLMVKNLVNLS
ncbi:MAG: GNAT family N-acetyltransferase [Bacteroidia bacterium]|nr:GNAT family N-acetyltransferase [Bacteroidia bacterium]